MQCTQCKEELLDLIYEAMRPRRKLELLDHVDRCPLCHEEYTDLLQSRSLLQEWPDEEVSWGLRLDPEKAVSFWPTGLRGWRSVALPGWLRTSAPVLRVAGVILLLAVGMLAATQSKIEWRDGAVTVQAQLWTTGNSVAGEPLEQQELLRTVDQIIAESEKRQNHLFGTALMKMYEDLEMRRRYEEGEIQTAFDRLQKQTETRWERTNTSTSQ
jgi:hypothetical protein